MNTAPNSADRIVDAVALLMVLGGIALFFVARIALGDIADGTRVAPPGMTNVALADFHVAQSKMGLAVIAIGVLVGIVAAVRHQLRRSQEPGSAPSGLRPAISSGNRPSC